MDAIKALLQQGNIRRAIDQLILEFKQTDYANELILQDSRHNNLLREKRMGLISAQEFQYAQADITEAILALVEEMEIQQSPKEEEVTDALHKKILFCEANPLPERNLFSNSELREIEDILENGNDRLSLYPKLGLSLVRFSRAVHTLNPHIIHFTAFSNNEGVYFHDEADQAEFIPTDFIEKQLAIVADHFECVFFNTFISEELAKKVSLKNVLVIGFNGIIDSHGAIEFATGFYTALSYGKPYAASFELGAKTVQKGRYAAILSHLYAYQNGLRLMPF